MVIVLLAKSIYVLDDWIVDLTVDNSILIIQEYGFIKIYLMNDKYRSV